MRFVSIGYAVFAVALCGLSVTAADLPAGERVASVQVLGAPTPEGLLQTKAGQPLDPAKIRDDVKKLWDSARYEDIQVESHEEAGAVAIVYRVKPLKVLRLRKITVLPATPGIDVQLPPGTPIDYRHAQEVADKIVQKLREQGYPHARVSARLDPKGEDQVDLHVWIEKGSHRKVDGVSLTGDLGVKPDEARKALHATRAKTMLPAVPHLWKGWHLLPDYSESAVEADIASLRSFYFRRGFFDSVVRVDTLNVGAENAQLGFRIQSGPRFAFRSVTLNGAGGLQQIKPASDAGFPARNLCDALLAERRKAEKEGIIDFAARVTVHDVPNGLVTASNNEARKWADATVSIQRGTPYHVGRIEFRGNHVLGDLTVRRAMLLDEGAPLDEMLLRKTLARLNRTGLFETLTESDVNVNTLPGSDRADLTINLKERKRGHWNFSGPVGPMSVAGPLMFTIGSRLPAWGRGILEASTYTASLSLMFFAQPVGQFLPFMPNKRLLFIATLQRPLLPGQRWTSGFVIAPQLGWQMLALGYGISQSRELFARLFQSDRSLTPPLLVTISHDTANPADDPLSQGTMACEPRKTGWDWAKQVGGITSNLVFMLSPF